MLTGKILDAWRGAGAERWTAWLMVAAAAVLPLQSTATVDIGYTLRPSYILLGAALVIGLPVAVRGWRRAPRWLGVIAMALAGVYLLATAFGDMATIAGTARGGGSRALVYLVDLVLGLGVIGLVCGLWAGLDQLRPLITATVVGAGLAALYAIWQWPAQEFGLPMEDILTTRDSNGVTTGGEQGPGLFGWERVRGTFLEPHFLGGFMASIAPLALAVASWTGGRLRMAAWAAGAMMILALILTSSASAWAVFGLAALCAAAAWGIGAGRPRPAMAAAMAACAAILLAPSLVVAPETLARATGRDAQTLVATADFRKQTWDTALDIWAARPAIGFGPGQSSVQLSLVQQGDRAAGLNSAQGVWAAALVDAGVPGLALWLLLLGGTSLLAFLALGARPSWTSAALAAAVLAGSLSALIATDRLDLRVWLLAGAAAASTTAVRPLRQGSVGGKGERQTGR